ncbi:unnamed protein product [Fraxinus pennsylvanica]|uniref:Uncharacterized protein n=1 Tax=Fraxinus pennsylvanica TaxID=56036 RepID=A0AAD2AFQ3_9LAMI|nr:unnamed protein product [Fraxinus pennsylvanica]
MGVRVPCEKTLESEGTNVPTSSFTNVVGPKEKGKGEGNAIGGGKKGWYLWEKGYKVDLDDLIKASIKVSGKGTFGTAYKAVLETSLVVVVRRLNYVSLGEKELRSVIVVFAVVMVGRCDVG